MINPARNAPSASEAPAAAVPSAVSVPIKMTAIRNSSRLRVLRISASARGTIVRAAMMTPATTSAAFPSASASPAISPCDLPARKGSKSMIGTTQRSWKIRTPVARRPCGASISPLSVSTLSTIAVLESAIRNPRNNATRQLPRKAEPTASADATVKVICENPAAKNLPPHLLEPAQGKLDANREQEQDDADFGESFDVPRIGDERERIGDRKSVV